ncbi:hypothetical protein [Amycolatopsis sp. H20-H5]|uniref:hypothetical protein n=1 Tax=Amycolatopsis sp. H20-H5 TaxID=3046309 RepID=UPI002DB76453|nr:hypothetical protein [Amycolatopsis sp. H20-H5]MEC3978074.1 hypothetical protein [Amycolatopsis sp. H20-H5]
MYWPVPASWTPHDEAELIAGWRLWLELRDRAWPNAAWDGTPAGASRQLLDLVAACDQVETEYRAAAAEPPGEIVRMVRSLVFAASAVVELWFDDFEPLEDERAELLHADLAGFGEHADRILNLLAANGGWTGLDPGRRRSAP